jgi:hypothetical protein
MTMQGDNNTDRGNRLVFLGEQSGTWKIAQLQEDSGIDCVLQLERRLSLRDSCTTLSTTCTKRL